MKTNEKTAPIIAEKDRNAVSLELMNRMKLYGMAAAFTESLSSTFAEAATPDSFLNWLLSREWDYRSEAAIQRLIGWPPSVTKLIRKRLTILSAGGLTATRWSGWLPWSSSDRRRTCSSQDPREPGKASWLPHWDTRHANPEYGLSMRAPRNSWDS